MFAWIGLHGVPVAPAADAPSGQMTLARQVSIAVRPPPALAGSSRRSTSIQQLMHEKAMYAPLLEPALLAGYGPRVAESGIGLITSMSSSAPYEELRLTGK